MIKKVYLPYINFATSVMKKILIVYFDTIISNDNLYVRSLYEELRRQGCLVDCSIDSFWDTSKTYDIIHFQFPEVIFKWRTPSEKNLRQLRNRIDELKRQHTKLIYTRHNSAPHYSHAAKTELYRIIETNCDAIIHLGEYSRQEYNTLYPQNKIEHFVVPHHIYDRCGYTCFSRKEAREKLHLPLDKFIILTFGSYRKESEREFIAAAFRQLPMSDKFLLAPGFYNDCFVNRRTPLQNFLHYHSLKSKYHPNPNESRLQHKKIDNAELSYYFSASDIVLIQRQEILNSGNIPMAFLFHKVAAGPSLGNLNALLTQTGNPVFNPRDNESVVNAIIQARQFTKSGLGEKNFEFAQQNMGTAHIAHKTIICYNNLLKI